jgi:hypothetical protein
MGWSNLKFLSKGGCAVATGQVWSGYSPVKMYDNAVVYSTELQKVCCSYGSSMNRVTAMGQVWSGYSPVTVYTKQLYTALNYRGCVVAMG